MNKARLSCLLPTILLSLFSVKTLAEDSMHLSKESVFFEDKAAHLKLHHNSPKRITFIDADSDGWLDVLISGSKLFMNERNENGRFFKEADDAIPLMKKSDNSTWTPTVSVHGDFNNDGHTDIILLDNYEWDAKVKGPGHQVMLNNGNGRFSLFKKHGLKTPSGETTIAAAAADINRDGNLDLFIGNSYIKYGRLAGMRDRLLLGNGDGSFKDASPDGMKELADPPGKPESARPTFGVSIGDLDDDGIPEIFTTSYGRQWNRIWSYDPENNLMKDLAPSTTFDGDDIRHGRYPEATVKYFKEKRNIDMEPEKPFRSNGNTFEAALADYNNDGTLDAFLGEIHHSWAGEASDRSMLLTNKGSRESYKLQRNRDIIPFPQKDGSFNEGDLHATWVDVDNDGLKDLLVASSDYPDDQRLKLYRQNNTGVFEDITDAAGLDWMGCGDISIGDFNRDGLQDILLGRSHMRLKKEQRKDYPMQPGLYINRSSHENAWVSIKLYGRIIKEQDVPDEYEEITVNQNVVGARIWVYADNRVQMKEIRAGEGHAGHQNPPEVHFGLGEAKVIDAIEIRWPDSEGTVERYNNLKVKNFYTITKGSSPIMAVPGVSF